MNIQHLFPSSDDSPTLDVPYLLLCDVLAPQDPARVDQVRKTVQDAVQAVLDATEVVDEATLIEALQAASQAVQAHKQVPTAVLLLAEEGDKLLVAGVGDYHLYRVRESGVELVFAEPYQQAHADERGSLASNLLGIGKAVEVHTATLSAHDAFVALPHKAYTQIASWADLGHKPDQLRRQLQERLASTDVTATWITPASHLKGEKGGAHRLQIALVTAASIAAIALFATAVLKTYPKTFSELSFAQGSGNTSSAFFETTEFSNPLGLSDAELGVLRDELAQREAQIATIQANEDALAEALMVRDSHVTELEGSVDELQLVLNEQVALQQQYQGIVADYQDLMELNDELRLTLGQVRTQLEETAGDRNELFTDYAALLEQYETVSTRLDADANRVGALMVAAEDNQDELQAAQLVLHDQQVELDLVQEDLKHARSELSIEEERYAALLEQMNRDHDLWNEKQGVLDQEVVVSRAEISKLTEEAIGLTSDITARELAIATLENEQIVHLERLQNLQTELSDLRADFEVATTSFVEQQDFALQLHQHNEELEQLLADRQMELHELQTTNQQMEGTLQDKETQLTTFTQEVERMSTRLALLEPLEEEHYTQESRLVALAFERDELTTQLQEAQQQLVDQKTVLAEVPTLHESLNQAMATLKGREEEVSRLQQNEQELRQQLVTQTEGLDQQLEEHNQLMAKFYDQERSLTDLMRDNSELLVALESTRLEHSELEGVLAEERGQHQASEHVVAEWEQIEKQLQGSQIYATELENQLQSVESQLTDRDQTIATLNKQREEVIAKATDLEQQLATLSTELATGTSLSDQLETAQTELAAEQARTNELMQNLDASRLALADQQAIALRGERTQEELHQQLAVAQTQIEQFSSDLAALQHQTSTLRTERDTLVAQAEAIEQAHTELDHERQLKTDRDDLIAQLAASMREQRETLVATQNSRADLAEELAELRALQGNLLFAERPVERSRHGARVRTSQRLNQTQRVHIASPGETLQMIARRYQVTLSDLERANRDVLGEGSEFKVGTPLIIP